MVGKREGGDGRRRGRGLFRAPRARDHQAGGHERHVRFAVLYRLHRRGGRARGRHRRRSGPVQLPERAGQPPLRQARQVPHAGTLRQPGMQGFHDRSRGHERTLRHARGHPHDHAHLTFQVRGGARRPRLLRARGRPLPPQHREVQLHVHVGAQAALHP